MRRKRSKAEERMIRTYLKHGLRRFTVLRSAERPLRQYKRKNP